MEITTKGPFYIDPHASPGKILVTVHTAGREDMGLFSGRHGGWDPDEEHLMEKRQPTVPGDNEAYGYETFEMVPLPFTRQNQQRQYYFAAISWENAVFVSYPKADELVVTMYETRGTLSFRGVVVAFPGFSLEASEGTNTLWEHLDEA